MNIISLPQGGGSSGGGGSSLFTFPLSIQEDQPTPEAKGHIWVLPSDQIEKATKIYIVNALSKDLDDNSLILVCNTNNNLKIDIEDTIVKSRKGYDFEFHSETSGVHDWAIALDEDGENIVSSRFPYVFTKDNGYFYVETARMWNGTYWSGLSTKDRYLFNFIRPYYNGTITYTQPMFIKNIYDNGESFLSIIDNKTLFNESNYSNNISNDSINGNALMGITGNGEFLYFKHNSEEDSSSDDNYSVDVWKRTGNIYERVQILFADNWANTNTIEGGISIKSNYNYTDGLYKTTAFQVYNPFFTYSGDKILFLISQLDSELNTIVPRFVEYAFNGEKYVYNKLISIDFSEVSLSFSSCNVFGTYNEKVGSYCYYPRMWYTNDDDLSTVMFSFNTGSSSSSNYIRCVAIYDNEKYKVVTYNNDSTAYQHLILGNKLWLQYVRDASSGSYYDTIFSYNNGVISSNSLNTSVFLSANYNSYWATYFGVLKSTEYPNKILLYGYTVKSSSGYNFILYDTENNKILTSLLNTGFTLKSGTVTNNVFVVSKISQFTGRALAFFGINDSSYPTEKTSMHVIKFDLDSIFKSNTIPSTIEDVGTIDNQLAWCTGTPPDTTNYYSVYNNVVWHSVYYSSSTYFYSGKFFITGDI